MKIASDSYKLKDCATGKEVIVFIEQENEHTLAIRPVDYGDFSSQDGHGTPVILEIWEGKLQLHVWDDINREDPRLSIDLEGARESNRKEN